MLFGIIGCYKMVGGGSLCYLVQWIPLIGIIIAALGSSIIAFGYDDVWKTLLTYRIFFQETPNNIPLQKTIVITRYLITATYASGSFIFLLCLIITMASIGGPLEQVGQHIGADIGVIMNTLVLSEAFLRPLKGRLEYLESQSIARSRKA
jgi:flagellar motor component MotA